MKPGQVPASALQRRRAHRAHPLVRPAQPQPRSLHAPVLRPALGGRHPPRHAGGGAGRAARRARPEGRPRLLGGGRGGRPARRPRRPPHLLPPGGAVRPGADPEGLGGALLHGRAGRRHPHRRRLVPAARAALRALRRRLRARAGAGLGDRAARLLLGPRPPRRAQRLLAGGRLPGRTAPRPRALRGHPALRAGGPALRAAPARPAAGDGSCRCWGSSTAWAASCSTSCGPALATWPTPTAASWGSPSRSGSPSGWWRGGASRLARPPTPEVRP